MSEASIKRQLATLFAALVLALGLGLTCSPAAALAQDAAQQVAPTAEPAIEVDSGKRDDANIEQRIGEIFAQIDALKAIEPRVRAGVVVLDGAAANDAQAQRAAGLARRIKGVVAVDDQIERTLDLQGNVSPLVDQIKGGLTWLKRALPLIGLAIVLVAVLTWVGYRLSCWTSLWRRLAPNPFLADLITQAVRVSSFMIGLVIALNLLGATALMGTLLGGAGVIGLAVGFAVRDSLGNYISSVMLSLRQPFRADDHVVIDDREGIVMRLTSRATILMTMDGNQLRIPNAQVFNAVILNYTTNPQRRFEFTLGVDADDDPVAAIATGLAPLNTLDFVLKDPAPSAHILTVGDSNIVIWFSAWVDQRYSDFNKSRSVAISMAKTALEKAGFSLPEPIYRLRFDQAPDRLGKPVTATPAEPSESEPAASSRKDRSGSSDVNARSVDVSPKPQLGALVNDQRAQTSDENLLDDTKPVE